MFHLYSFINSLSRNLLNVKSIINIRYLYGHRSCFIMDDTITPSLLIYISGHYFQFYYLYLFVYNEVCFTTFIYIYIYTLYILKYICLRSFSICIYLLCSICTFTTWNYWDWLRLTFPGEDTSWLYHTDTRWTFFI